jgi:hypothetical protein
MSRFNALDIAADPGVAGVPGPKGVGQIDVISWWRAERAEAANAGIVGLGAAIGLLLLIGTAPSMMRLRIEGFAHLSRAAAPILEAVDQYEREQGRPPKGLEDLVPCCMPDLPRWSGRLGYLSAEESAWTLYDNPWRLVVDASFGFGFDQFVYLPRQNYPKYMFGGSPERVGAWVYVHE